MKRLFILLSIITVFGSLLVVSPKTYAVDIISDDVCKNASDSPACPKSKSTDNVISGNEGIITKATRIIAIIGGVAAVIIIIIAGFRFITAGGNPETVASAKNTIIYAVIGLVVIVIAQAIVVFVVQKL